jgi:hypothetical protein
VEQENKNTFLKNVDEVAQIESFPFLRNCFKITEEEKILWFENNVPQKIKGIVNYLAEKYLV